MIDTILFDLDGTLLKVTQKAFLGIYLRELQNVFVRLGMDGELSVKALWAGTNAMIVNDGVKPNDERFWEVFAQYLGFDDGQRKTVEAACEKFYMNEFNAVKAVAALDDDARRLVRALTEKGYLLALATNPLFPLCAVETRLAWIGLLPQDFSYITHYANSSYCKPNPGYYRELLENIGKEPRQCLMAGNSVSEDMCAGALGIETFLVTDYLENESGAGISLYRHGSLADCEAYLTSLATS